MTLRGCFALIATLAAIPAVAAPVSAAVFGSVVAIGGSASDIALDESRGLLYIANFGASAIEVMSTTDNTIPSSMNVPPFPGAIALSADAQYLLIAHYCNLFPPPPRLRQPVPMPLLPSIWPTIPSRFSRWQVRPWV